MKKFTKYKNSTHIICHNTFTCEVRGRGDKLTFRKGKVYSCRTNADSTKLYFNDVVFHYTSDEDVDYITNNFSSVDELIELKHSI